MESYYNFILIALGTTLLVFTLRREQGQHLPKIQREPTNEAEFNREIQQLLSQSKKIEAIKLTRKYKNMDLKSAKLYVESLQGPGGLVNQGITSSPRSLNTELNLSEFSATLSPELKEKFEALLRSGNNMEAIKLLQARGGIGLKEAKELIDAYLAYLKTAPSDINNQDVRNLLRQGKKIDAIKALRSQRGIGLQEAIAELERIEREMR